MSEPIPIATSLPPNTTAEEDLKTHGQRQINLKWENTQATIALSVTITALFVSSAIAMMAVLKSEPTDQQLAMAITAFLFLSNITSLVVGFYFGRTNHTRTGGAGSTLGESR